MTKSKTNKKRKQQSTFGRRLKKYIIVLCILSAIFLIHVMNTLYQYEASFTDNYMKEYVQDLTKAAKKGKLDKYCDFNNVKVNELETNKASAQKALEDTIKNSNVTYKLEKNNKSAQESIYGIYANDEKILDVTLNVKKQNHRLGLFSYPTWQVKENTINKEHGIYYYDISVPSNYTVTVNGSKVPESFITDTQTDANYEILSKYAELPKMVTYRLDNFISKPDIKIADEQGKDADYQVQGHNIKVNSLYRKVDNYDEAKQYLAEEIDVLDIAEKWSLFLTDDLQGGRHGFNNLSQYLVKGTSLYDMAYSWATSIDITFTSKHTLKNPAFTNTKVDNFEIYGKTAFSCTLYLEKNMKIANGNDKTDVMHDKLYFVYYDDTNDGKDNPQWKMIEMKAVTENKGR